MLGLGKWEEGDERVESVRVGSARVEVREGGNLGV